MNRKAIIFGLKGYNLTKTEKKFIKKNKPWGIILFSRNIKNIIQPGGSIRDDSVIDACNKYDMMMVCSGQRLFYH